MDTEKVFNKLGLATVTHKVPLFLFDFHKMKPVRDSYCEKASSSQSAMLIREGDTE